MTNDVGAKSQEIDDDCLNPFDPGENIVLQ